MSDYDRTAINGEDRFWLKMFCIIFTFALLLFSTIFYYDYKKDIVYINQGYQKTPIMGPVNYQWQKVK